MLAVFNRIPAELGRHEKKFVLADLGRDARMRDYDTAFEWLKSAMTVNVAYAAAEPAIGLEMRTDVMSLKCYLADTGLLVSMAFDPVTLESESVHERILHDRLSLDKGMLMENMVAQMIRASGRGLYFYSNSDRTNAENRMEIDFLVCKSGLTRMHNIIPVEVKSSRAYEFVSLGKFRRKFPDQLHEPVVLHPKDLRVDDGIVYLPLYMAGLLLR